MLCTGYAPAYHIYCRLASAVRRQSVLRPLTYPPSFPTLAQVYWQKRRKVIKAQACARMWPLYRQFRYFKVPLAYHMHLPQEHPGSPTALSSQHVVIRAQSWARRTIKRNRFVLERRSAWMVQKYVRRYINILWHLRRVQSVWRPAEERLEPVVAIQCRWRITLARRLVLARALYRQRRLWATLLTQRNWYRLRGASVTFFLMAAYRARVRARPPASPALT